MTASYSSGRRRFVRNALLGTAAVVLMPEWSLAAGGKTKKRKLTILHTNDMHSRIDPFPEDDPKYAGKGGMERRAAMIKMIREQEENVLLLDSGDIFQGTPYFNFFGGEPEFRLMTQMKYDAATMGNHDFDNGLEGFLRMLPHAGFPFVCSNYDFSDTILKDKTLEHLIIPKGDLRIGLFGLGIELSGLVARKNYGKTHYLDPLTVADSKAKALREAGCHLVICLSHLGYSYKSNKISDLQLAQKTNGIDIILGGHTHTFMDKASEIKNKDGKNVLVSQSGWGGIRLGRIDIEFVKAHGKPDNLTEISYIGSSNKDVI